MNFVAIDFETANNFKGSACALGLVRVENGNIVERKEWMIKPTPFEMGFYQNQVHKIELKDLVDKPTFKEIWHELKPLLDNQVVIAHNASFDFGVLNSVCSHYNIQTAQFTPMCSIALSRMAWQGEIGYGLSYLVASKLENYRFNHHNALEDAEACAHLVLKVLDELSLTSIEEIYLFKANNQAKKRSTGVSKKKKTLEIAINESHSNAFNGKEVVFTGTLEYFVRKDAQALIKRLGGSCSSGVSNKTDYVVIGQSDVYRVSQGYKSSKISMAEQLVAVGYKIRIITENEFIEMLSV